MDSPVWSALGMLAVAVAILLLAYGTTRWIASAGATGRLGMAVGNPSFRVLSQITLGRNEHLVLLRIGEGCCLLGVTENRITLLKEWEGGEAREWLEEQGASPGFLETLRENLRNRK